MPPPDLSPNETGKETPATPPPGGNPAATTQPARSILRPVLVVAGLGALVVGGVIGVNHYGKTSAPSGSASAAKAEALPVPVMDGVVARQDVPIFLDGLGTVQAFNTVTIRSRVDGQLQKLAFVDGQDVRSGAVLAQIDPAPFQAQMEQAAAKKAQDEAQLANLRIELKRDAELLAGKVLAQADYDTAKALVNQLEAAVQADQAAIESTKIQLAYTTIVSPIDGRSGIRLVDQGNTIHANDANGLVVITQLRPISVVFTLPEQTRFGIQTQMAAGELQVTAMGRDNRTVVEEGKLAVIDNQIDTTTGTIKLKATFTNENLRLWPGQFINTRLRLTTRKDGVVVPASVVQRGPEGAFAFVIKPDQTVEMRPLKVAQIENGLALIDDGLQPGERVVVDGQYKLQPGSKVKPGGAPTGGSGADTPKKNRPGKKP